MIKYNRERKKTVVIFGASSFIGSNLCAYLKKDFRVIGTYHRNKYFCPGVLTIPCDVLAKEEVRLVMLAFKPDVAIYCVGILILIIVRKTRKSLTLLIQVV